MGAPLSSYDGYAECEIHEMVQGLMADLRERAIEV
jgi:hypothetical protein